MQISLPELSRDLVILYKGDTITAQVRDDMAAAGWAGGQFGRWVVDASGFPTLALADGRYCGFFLFGSSEAGDQYTAMTEQNPHYKYVVLGFGGNVFYTRTFEQYGYLARHGLGPMVPLSYEPQQILYVSENGKITPENESDLATYGIHNFPDGTPVPDMSFTFFGICAVPPMAKTNQYMCIQTNFGV